MAGISGSSGGHPGRPAVGLAFQLAAPAVERVVEHEAVPQHLVVVAEARPQAERDGEEPGRLGRQVEPLGIRAADDPGELVECRIVQPVLRQERVEAAPLAHVRELDPRHVVGNGAGLFGHLEHALGRHEKKFRCLIDEAGDQPRAGKAVDDRALARNPFHLAISWSAGRHPACRSKHGDTYVACDQRNDTREPMPDLDHSVLPAERWLLLIHQLPAKPAYLRVKVWRRLQGLGAVAVKATVYALPAKPEAQEDFEWLLREIVQGGGEAMICEARLVDGLTDQEVRALFDRTRDADYDELAKEVRTLAAAIGDDPPPEQRTEAKAQLARLKARLAQVTSIDFFGANGREAAEGLSLELEGRLREKEAAAVLTKPAPSERSFGELK